MALNDSDRFVINDGSDLNTITFAQFKDGTVLNPTDLFLVNDGTKTETITWEEIEDEIGPKGVVVQPTVVKPKDGAGSGEERYLKTDTITSIGGGGIHTCETDTIESVTSTDLQTNSIKWTSNAPGGSTEYTIIGTPDNVFGPDQSAFMQMQYTVTQIVDLPDFTITVSPQKQASTVEFKYTHQRGNDGQKDQSTLIVEYADGTTETVTGTNLGNYVYTANLSHPEKPVAKLSTPSQRAGAQNPNEGRIAYYFKLDGRLLDNVSQDSILTFPSNNNFDCFPPGTVVQDPDVTVISQDEDANTITVDGGTWTTSDKLVKETPYDTTLTVAGPTDLADMTGSVFATDGDGAPGPYTQTPYKLVTTDIESVASEGFFLLTSRPSNLSDVVAGTPYNDGDALPDGGFLVCVPGREISSGQVFTNNGSNSGFTATTALGGGFFKADGTFIGNSDANYNASDWTNFNYTGGSPTSSPSLNYIYTGGEVSYFVLNLVSGTTGPTVNSSISVGVTTLTFPGDVSTNPDLRYFLPGDLVQGGRSPDAPEYISSSRVANPENAFDGDNSTGAIFQENRSYIKFNTSETTIKLRVRNDSSGSAQDIGIFTDSSGSKAAGSWESGGNSLQPPNSTTVEEAYTFTEPGPYYLKTPINTGNNVIVYQIGDEYPPVTKVISTGYLDGTNSNTMTVDGGAWAQGGTVEYQTKGGNGTIVEVNTDENTLLINKTGDRDNRWVAENKAGTDFSVAGPSIIDEPLLTSTVELESSQFATIPEGVDGLKEIIWELNGVEQSAGTLNPYRPSGLLTNTTYTVRVQHLAQKLEPSEWSTSTTFTTGASFTLKDHYMARIRELEAEVEAIKDDGGQLPPQLKPTPGTRSAESESRRKRARNKDGTYRGDDPSTPDVNEAWEQDD